MGYTEEDARDYMIRTLTDIMTPHYCLSHDPQYFRGQAVGMVKAFKKMGVIPEDDPNGILEELLDMI